jgi:hypothetical protein
LIDKNNIAFQPIEIENMNNPELNLNRMMLMKNMKK